ncbi:MAG: OmpA family protein [Bacteroidota bacterium]
MNLNLPTKPRTIALMILGLLLFAPVSAQTVAKDTVNLRDKHKLRQAMYESNQEAFPPPRRNNWSLGVQKGLSYVSGDVRAERGLGIGVNLRRALGHTFSLRGAVGTGYARGLNWRPNGGFLFNHAWNGTSDNDINYIQDATYDFVFYNYRMRYWDANLQLVANLGNISFNNREPKVSFYTFAGLGGLLYRTDVDARDAGGIYDFTNIAGTDPQDPDNRRETLNSLRALLDGEFETPAERHSNRRQIFDRTLVPSGIVGVGIGFKMSRRVSLSLEHRVTWTGDDLLDGHRWEETNTLTANPDYLQFSTIGINFRLGKGEESLWWQNPLSTIYSDVRDLKRFGARKDKDTDNDGIPDNRDKEANTPEGVMVDAQGRALDSDGDGIQDFRDKEPFSPKGAEVDKSGVALDSDDDGVIDLFDAEPNSADGAQADAKGKTIEAGGVVEAAPEFPIINFDLGKSDVREEYYPDLYRVAKMLQDDPNLKLNVIGHADVRGRSKKNDQLSKMRAQAVVAILTDIFLIEKDRLILEGKGAESLLVKNLPGIYSKENEPLHYLNRRVEFSIVE